MIFQKKTVAIQTSPPRGTQPKNYVVATEQSPRNQTGNEPVPFLNCSTECPTGIQNSEQHVTTTLSGDRTIPSLTIRTPLIEERLVRDQQKNAVYLPLTSTVVLRRKREMLYVPLNFKNRLTVDGRCPGILGGFVSAFALKDMDKIKKKVPDNVLKIDDPLIFQIQVANR